VSRAMVKEVIQAGKFCDREKGRRGVGRRP
jgi:hypothetical protein